MSKLTTQLPLASVTHQKSHIQVQKWQELKYTFDEKDKDERGREKIQSGCHFYNIIYTFYNKYIYT